MQSPPQTRVANDLAWTFPAAIVLSALTLFGWGFFAVLSRSMPPACEMLGRTAWTAAECAACAAFLLPLSLIERVVPRIAVAVVAAAVFAAGAWWLTALLFPRFC